MSTQKPTRHKRVSRFLTAPFRSRRTNSSSQEQLTADSTATPDTPSRPPHVPQSSSLPHQNADHESAISGFPSAPSSSSPRISSQPWSHRTPEPSIASGSTLSGHPPGYPHDSPDRNRRLCFGEALENCWDRPGSRQDLYGRCVKLSHQLLSDYREGEDAVQRGFHLICNEVFKRDSSFNPFPNTIYRPKISLVSVDEDYLCVEGGVSLWETDMCKTVHKMYQGTDTGMFDATPGKAKNRISVPDEMLVASTAGIKTSSGKTRDGTSVASDITSPSIISARKAKRSRLNVQHPPPLAGLSADTVVTSFVAEIKVKLLFRMMCQAVIYVIQGYQISACRLGMFLYKARYTRLFVRDKDSVFMETHDKRLWGTRSSFVEIKARLQTPTDYCTHTLGTIAEVDQTGVKLLVDFLCAAAGVLARLPLDNVKYADLDRLATDSLDALVMPSKSSSARFPVHDNADVLSERNRATLVAGARSDERRVMSSLEAMYPDIAEVFKNTSKSTPRDKGRILSHRDDGSDEGDGGPDARGGEDRGHNPRSDADHGGYGGTSGSGGGSGQGQGWSSSFGAAGNHTFRGAILPGHVDELMGSIGHSLSGLSGSPAISDENSSYQNASPSPSRGETSDDAGLLTDDDNDSNDDDEEQDRDEVFDTSDTFHPSYRALVHLNTQIVFCSPDHLTNMVALLAGENKATVKTDLASAHKLRNPILTTNIVRPSNFKSKTIPESVEEQKDGNSNRQDACPPDYSCR